MNAGAVIKNVAYIKNSYYADGSSLSINLGSSTFENVALYTSIEKLVNGNATYYSGSDWSEVTKAYVYKV